MVSNPVLYLLNGIRTEEESNECKDERKNH